MKDLATRMYDLANTGHPRAEELREKARLFRQAADDPEVDERKLLGAWARARRLWCQCTGEPLI